MGTEYKIFEYIGQQVRVVYKEGSGKYLEPWFNLADVCGVLGIANSRDIKKRIRDPHVDSIYIGVQTGLKKDGTPAMQNVKASFVDETGLNICVLRSRKKEAEDFTYYIAEVVIPELRRSGGYFAGMENLSDDDKEDARKTLSDLQKKYNHLQEIHAETLSDYEALFTRTKEALGTKFALGVSDSDKGDEPIYVIDPDGMIYRKELAG